LFKPKIFVQAGLLITLQEREGKERGVTLRAAQYRKGLFHLMNETINPGLLSKSSRKNVFGSNKLLKFQSTFLVNIWFNLIF
jgi:hypothetical protein